jgi:hypothetical protein
MKKVYNEYAFPLRGTQTDEDLEQRINGMTLRDYFAAAALSNEYTANDGSAMPSDIAKWAYQVADAMLRYRCNE